MKLHITYVNGATTTLHCAKEMTQLDLDGVLRSGAGWFRYEKLHYVNLANVLSITVINSR